MSSVAPNEARPAADRSGAATPRRMGRECLVRSAADPDRLDFRCGVEAAGPAAQLGRLCASPLPARDADPRAAAESVGQTARIRDIAATGATRVVDLARPRDDACRTALHKPLSQRRGPLR